MIASLRGQVRDLLTDAMVVEISGIGLQVYVPTTFLDGVQIGDPVFLYTYLVVREDALTLYGFPTSEEREYFTLLLSVNGVGPRSALNTLSVLTPDAMRGAIFHEQPEVFDRVPGIGRKTSQKILLHLQDRIPAGAGLEPVSGMSDLDGELLNALTALGYSVVEAQTALQAIPHDAPENVEERLRLALQFFG